ncbi:MAG TPA: recombinase family protein [Solirubrobacteraceae bacterium]|nr:recombinase family protein [Solirubrobacteraceae bacterium]
MSLGAVTHKVSAEHLARAAYLYVRQSTLRQVKDNTESAERQYALRQRAVQLGWSAEQIIVIDSDQGRSGASSSCREGFQRLVADVGLGKAGIVLGLEVSRLARNNADWHRLLEISALAGTLICDEDGLYDPADFNDRLLLGLKGTMSEAELHFIRARLQGGILSKARRGELPMPLPVGLVTDPTGKVVLDPDTAVQQALAHLFQTFERTGSARGVVQTFNREGLLFPARVRAGERKGELTWAPLTHWRVLRTLHNPRYAGAFAYGQRRTRKTANGKTTTRHVPREQWTLIRDAHPGYITFDQYERNLNTLTANATAHGPDRAAGPAREGAALLQGLAICGRCGRRMTVRYHARNGTRVPDYQCVGDSIQNGGTRCLVIPGAAGVDATISKLLLDTVTPLALEVALGVQAELEARAEETDRLRRTHVERARQRAELARRRYLAVDPDNRLVADTLEADWNNTLRSLQDAQDEYERQTAAANAQLTEERKQQIRRLAADFPKLWNDPATPPREHKRIARLLIEDVTLARTDQIHLHVRFRGGQTTTLTIPRALNAWEARQTPTDTLAEIDRLLDQHTDAETADQLNTTGHRSGTGKPFTRTMIVKLRHSNGLLSRRQRLLAHGMLTQEQIAERLGVSRNTIHAWRRAGLLHAHRANDKNDWLYQPPIPGDPRLIKRRGWRHSKREPARSTQGGAM